jgi:hypothetical protein
MKKLKIVGILLLVLHMSAYGQTTPSKPDLSDKPTEWLILSEEGYEIKCPDNWDIDTSGQMGTQFILLSPVSSPADQFRENVNLLIQDLTGYDLTLDQYVELSENQIETMMTNGKLISSERKQGKGFDFHEVIYTGKQGVFDLKFEQYYWVLNNEAFVLTLTCEMTEFDNYRSTGETILSSFEIKKK